MNVNRPNNRGFTLVEMIVVMAVFTVVIAIAGKSFDLVVKQVSIVSKSEESNVEGVVGLEMFRRDLTQVGFGLFTEVETQPTSIPFYDEATSAPGSIFNDKNTLTAIPRAVVAGNNLNVSGVLPNTDYLALKGTTLGFPTNKTSQKWSYKDTAGSGLPKTWGENDFGNQDNIVVLRQMSQSGIVRRILVNNPGAAYPFSTTYNSAALIPPYVPAISGSVYYYYGLSGSDVSEVKRPFNRTDYLVKRVTGSVPASCSPIAGVLYKNSLNQQDGNYVPIPIMDCVADMQVVFGWNTSGITSQVDTWTDAAGGNVAGGNYPYPVNMSDPDYIRSHLKLIKVYILSQDSGLDKNFSNTNNKFLVGEPGEASQTREVDLTQADMLHYRWKLHRLVVRPTNLN